MPLPSTTPSPHGPPNDPSARGIGSPSPEDPSCARDRRLVVLVEAFLRQVRRGGSLDPEPFLRSADELRDELEPLLLGVLRLEQISEGIDPPLRRRPPDIPERS